MEDMRENFDEWCESFESKWMRVNIGKAKLMVSGMKGEMLDSSIDPCGVCGTRVMSNLVLCTVKCCSCPINLKILSRQVLPWLKL